ncbi:MAG: hypothetical protein ACYC9M_13465 [Desulfobulbaceae bacterium]
MTVRPFLYRLRPLHFLVGLLCVFGLVHALLYFQAHGAAIRRQNNAAIWDTVTSALGLTDLCVATEARYTRHPAVSDPMAPFMDHPGAIEHFPTGSFWAPPGQPAEREGL